MKKYIFMVTGTKIMSIRAKTEDEAERKAHDFMATKGDLGHWELERYDPKAPFDIDSIDIKT